MADAPCTPVSDINSDDIPTSDLPIEARINKEPHVPPFVVELELDNASLNGPITYEAWVTYKEHGRDDRSQRISGTTNSLQFTLDFGSTVQGGTLRKHASVPWKQVDSETGDVATGTLLWDCLSSIRGDPDNPAKNEIKSRLGALPLQVIAYKESRFRQFKSNGLPMFGVPHGFGIMQLDPPPSAREIWDWKRNIDAGARRYEDGKGHVQTHYNNMRQTHPKLPDLTAEQLKLASYQYYNSGGGHEGKAFYWVPDDVAGTKWVKNPTTKTIDGKVTHPFTAYGDDAVRIEELVTKGTAPDDWQ